MPEAELPAPEPPPPTHSVYDLIANRHLLHRQVHGGLLIDAGQPGFGRYIHGNRPARWTLNQEQDGNRVAHPERGEVTLYVPLSAEQAASARVLQIRFWYETGRYPLEVTVAGQVLGEYDPVEGWQTATFEVPAQLLAAGENTIELEWPSDGVRQRSRVRSALEQVFIGPSPIDFDSAPPTDWPAPGAAAGDEGLYMAAGDGLVSYVVLPPNPSLQLHFVGQESAQLDPDCTLELVIEAEDGSSRRWEAPPGSEELHRVELAGVPIDEVVRLSLSLGDACPLMGMTAGAIHTTGEAPFIPEFEPPRNVLFWMIDTLRADRLTGINPHTRVQTPALDEFVSEGALFSRAYVQGNESFASHAAVFSGRYPAATGVRSSRDHLGNDSELIAELARRADRFTGGYSSNGHIRSSNGFEQGFQTYVNTLRDNYRYKAPGMLQHAIRWIDDHSEQPFFFYLGTVDCHVTYRSHEDILPMYDAEPYDGPFQRTVGGDELGRIKGGSMRITARDRVRIEAIYDDTVTFTDRHFGELMEHLETTGVLDETLVIVTSDHGDEFWEHDSVGHGHNVYDELVHVPLLMRYPGAIPPRTVVTEGVDTVDILPTIAHLLGVEPSERAQGESLLGLIHGVTAGYPRPAYSQQYGRLFAMSLHRWKIVWRSGGERALFDTRTDPTEQDDVAQEHPYALRFVTDAMGLFLPYRSRWVKQSWGVASNLNAGFAP